MLAAHVHPNLVEPAGNLCTNVEAFGGAIEKLLIKHGKNIIHEQFLLNRIAQACNMLYNRNSLPSAKWFQCKTTLVS